LLAADLRQAKSIHRAWHDNVRKQQVEFDALLKMTQRFGGIFRTHHALSKLLEQRGRHVSDVAAVSHDKHCALNILNSPRSTFTRFRRHFGLRTREIDGYNGALFRLACDRDRSTGLIGKTMHL